MQLSLSIKILKLLINNKINYIKIKTNNCQHYEVRQRTNSL